MTRKQGDEVRGGNIRGEKRGKKIEMGERKERIGNRSEEMRDNEGRGKKGTERRG